MSSDTNRSSRRRMRLIDRPLLAAGPLKDLKDVIYRLYLEAGPPTLDQIADDVRRLAEELASEMPGAEEEVDSLIGATPRRDTIARIIGAQDFPANQQDVVAVAVALARAGRRLNGPSTSTDVVVLANQIRLLWMKATVRPPEVRIGKPVTEYTPYRLEVHRAIDLGVDNDLATLPAYVPRAHDGLLKNVVAKALSGRSCIATLVGESSTGKTRACWEAIQDMPAQWRLWHPIDPGRPEAALETLHKVGPNTVIWLNEAQLYLQTPDPVLGERVAAGLRSLLSDPALGPVLVLATVWPQNWASLTAPPKIGSPDRLAQARELLTGSDIRVPTAFTHVDLDALGRLAASDPRLREAAERAHVGRITQYLAGVPELLQRYRNAPSIARAIIDVAVDARRFGHTAALPRVFLEQATPGYLADHDWNQAPDDWLAEAIDYTSEPCHGTPGPLVRIRTRSDHRPTPDQSTYRLADYLEQIGDRERAAVFPPQSFWNAIASTVGDVDLLRMVGDQAARRGRLRHAARLYRLAIDGGSAVAGTALAYIYRQTGNPREAESLARWAADCGERGALWSLSRWYEQAGKRRQAEELAMQAAERGATVALRGLAELRQRAGDRTSAEKLNRQAADQGDAKALRGLAQIHECSGNVSEAGRLYRQAAHLGDTVAMRGLAEMRERAGHPEEALDWALKAAVQGDLVGLRRVAKLREGAGDLEGAADLYWKAADYGDNVALRSLARMREQAGDHAAAETLVQKAVDRGAPIAVRYLAELRERAGDLNSAADLYRRAADYGDNPALRSLARMREQAGDRAAAETLVLEAANRGDPRALRHMAQIREQIGDKVGATRLRRFGLTEDGQPASSLE